MLPQVEFLLNPHPEDFLLRASLSIFPVFVLGIALIQMQDLILGLAELHEIGTDLPLKPVKVPLDDIESLTTTLKCDHPANSLFSGGSIDQIPVSPV